jgi:transmembrane sensor
MTTPPINDRLAVLAFKKVTGNLSEEEADELNRIIESSADKKKLYEELMDPDIVAKEVVLMSEFDVETSWEKVKDRHPFPPKKWGWVQYTLAAASVLFVIGLAVYFLVPGKKETPAVVQNENKVSAAKAIIIDSVAFITLPGGDKILVDQSQSGTIGSIGAEPLEMKGNVLICPAIVPATEGSEGQPVIKTVPGRDLNVQLSDGTQVLMSGSSGLRFPAGFTAGKRKVVLEGEAYFEVAKNGSTPFTVQVGEMEIQVLGTKFNVSARKEQGPVITSLMEGKVKVKAGEQIIFLSPGEEAVWANQKFSKRDLGQRSKDKVEGKKNGLFVFNNNDTRTILEEVADNYNCSIEYNGTMPAKTFSGNFSRNGPINMLLNNLSGAMGIGLTIQGNTILVDYTKRR